MTATSNNNSNNMCSTTTQTKMPSQSPPSKPSSPISMSVYDVLLVRIATNDHQDEDSSSSSHARQLDFFQVSSSHAIGNNRFQVFVKMNVQSFVEATSRHEQDTVAQTIHDTVCVDCIDESCHRAGKFLVLKEHPDTPEDNKITDPTESMDHWDELDNDTARAFVFACLEKEQEQAATIAVGGTDSNEDNDTDNNKNNYSCDSLDFHNLEDSNDFGEVDEKKRRRRSSLLRRSVSSGDMLVPMGDGAGGNGRARVRNSILLQLMEYDDSDYGSDPDEEDTPIDQDNNDDDKSGNKNGKKKTTVESKPSKTSRASMKAAAADAALVAKDDMDEGQSESHNKSWIEKDVLSASIGTFDSVTSQKRERRSSKSERPTVVRSPSWTSPKKKDKAIFAAEPLDVLLVPISGSSNSYQMLPNHTGNNRVEVMIQIKFPRYLNIIEKDPKNKVHVHSLCREIVDIVQNQYKARFLVEQKDQKSYLGLTDEQATAALENLFSKEAAKRQTEEHPALPDIIPGGREAQLMAIARLKKGKQKKSRRGNLERAESGGLEQRLAVETRQPVPPSALPTRFASTGGVNLTLESETMTSSPVRSMSLPVETEGNPTPAFWPTDVSSNGGIGHDMPPTDPTMQPHQQQQFLVPNNRMSPRPVVSSAIPPMNFMNSNGMMGPNHGLPPQQHLPNPYFERSKSLDEATVGGNHCSSRRSSMTSLASNFANTGFLSDHSSRNQQQEHADNNPMNMMMMQNQNQHYFPQQQQFYPEQMPPIMQQGPLMHPNIGMPTGLNPMDYPQQNFHQQKGPSSRRSST